jgi:outer membrane protein OmpA-like peptidoglycan-associated protein
VLGLNGIGLRNLMVIKVYVAGLYLKSGSTDPAAIINADEPMVMRLQMLRETKPKTMNQALLNGMRNSAGTGFSQISDRVDKFKAMIYDPLLEGDVFNFIYTPGNGVDVYKGKEHRGTVPGLDFKKAFFGIWLNDSKPADEGLKAGLIAGKFTTELAAITEKAKQEKEAKIAAEAQAQADAAAAVAKKAEDDAKMASAEAAKKVAEVKKAEKDVAAAVVSEEDAAAAEAKKVADQAKAAEKAAAAATAKAEAEAKEAADLANVEAYASADQFAADDVYFNINSTKLNAAAKMNLARKVKYLKANPGATVVLEPVCDTQGAKEKNIALANKRGDSVREFIIGAGIDASRIETVDVRQVDAAGPYVNNRRVHLSIK